MQQTDPVHDSASLEITEGARQVESISLQLERNRPKKFAQRGTSGRVKTARTSARRRSAKPSEQATRGENEREYEDSLIAAQSK